MGEDGKRPRLEAPHGAGPKPSGSIAITSSGEVIATAPTTSSESAESGRFLRRVLLIAAVALVLALLWFTRDVLLLVFAGVLAAVFLSGLTSLVTRYTPLPRNVALTLILLTMLTLAVLGVWLLGAELAAQFGELSRGLAKSVDRLQAYLEETPLGDLFKRRVRGTTTGADQWTILSQAAGVLSTGVGMLAAPLIVAVIGIYLAINPHLYRRALLALVPIERRPRVRDILHLAAGVLWDWLMGRLFSMTLIGLTTGIGLWLMGVPMALSLGLIAFVTNFVPYLGPLISAVPAVLMAFSSGGSTQVIYVLLLYGAIQLVETHLLTPLVEQQAVSMPPAFTLAVEMLGGVLLGGPGVLFATPLAATAVVLIKTLYVEDVLGDRPQEQRTEDTDQGTGNGEGGTGNGEYTPARSASEG